MTLRWAGVGIWPFLIWANEVQPLNNSRTNILIEQRIFGTSCLLLLYGPMVKVRHHVVKYYYKNVCFKSRVLIILRTLNYLRVPYGSSRKV